MKAPCRAHLATARELLAFGVIDEAARALVDLRRCAATPGCEDWRNCSSMVENAWQGAGENALPEARPRPTRTRED